MTKMVWWVFFGLIGAGACTAGSQSGNGLLMLVGIGIGLGGIAWAERKEQERNR